MADLDAILSGKETESVEQPRDEDGRWVAAGDAPEVPEVAPPAAVVPEPEPVKAPEPIEDRVPQAALLDERRKRQQAERESQELREQLERAKKPPVDEDVWADPGKAISAAEQRAIAAAEAKMREQAFAIDANFSERLARRDYKDYDEKRAVFQARLESDPVLQSALNRHVENGGDLGQFVYTTATKLQELEQVGNLDAYRDKIRSEERAKLEAEMKRPAVPQSLNATPSPTTTTEHWSGPPPLDAILKRK
jgi:hypothetical protein